MRKILSGIPLLFQVILTFIVLFGIYMIYALLDVLEIDMIAGIGFIIFQPILAFILTSLTILACLVVGLPIRLVKSLYNFWITKPWIPVTSTILGILLLLLSYNSNFTEFRELQVEFETVQKEVPNMSMALAGWFLIAFNLLHLYPQTLIKFCRLKMQNLFSK